MRPHPPFFCAAFPLADTPVAGQVGRMDPQPGQTVQEVATQTFVVETTPAPAAEPPLRAFERRFANQQMNPFRDWNPMVATIRGYRIPNAMVDGGMHGLWNRDGFLHGTGYIRSDDELIRFPIEADKIVEWPDDVIAIIGCNFCHHNYFHWLTQSLPAIDHALGRNDRDRNIMLVLPVLNAWQEESLRLLGYDRVRRATLDDPAKFHRFRTVEYSELIKGGASFKPSVVTRRTYTRLRQAVPKTRWDGRRLYVARTDTDRRTMLNEDAVIEEMRRRGFEILVPGTMSMTEQIRTFREASIVVGPHGAGMSNIVFCDPGTIVYELLPAHYRNGCFAALGLTCRLRYWTDWFDSTYSGDEHLSVRPWDLDFASFRRRLDEIAAMEDRATARPASASGAGQ